MAWITTISNDEASGPLKRQFDAAVARAGKVYNIVRIMGLNPPVLQASMGLYLALMKGPSPLSRGLRELLAVVVSRANACHY
jgi:alkylhydroperoxidase family enzyme